MLEMKLIIQNALQMPVFVPVSVSHKNPSLFQKKKRTPKYLPIFVADVTEIRVKYKFLVNSNYD